MSPPKTLRVDETASQRAARLRSEMHAVGDPPPADAPKDERAASDAALASDRQKYLTMKLEDVLEEEIKVGLALPYDKLYANARHQLIKAGVNLIAVRNKIGPAWGAGLSPDDEDGE